MTDRDDAIAGLRASIGGIDPVLDASEAYARGIKEVQKTTRAQGHVMSAALDNNANLWEIKKALERENRELKRSNHRLAALVKQQEIQLDQASSAYATLESAGGDKWRALYEQCRKTLTLYTSDAFDLPELEQRLLTMKEQSEALKAELTERGIAPAALPDRAAVDAHMQREGLDERGEQLMPGGLEDL